jgi:MEMO1 family protein
MGNIFGYYSMPHPPIIIPEVGKGEEGKITSTHKACMKIAEYIEASAPNTIIIITPHGPVFRDAIALSIGTTITGNLGGFGAVDTRFNCGIDLELSKRIVEVAHGEGIPVATITEYSAKHYGVNFELDHGTMIPLYFINKKYPNYKLVHITYGILPKLQLYRFGIALREAVETSLSNAVIVASGDMSHKLTEDGPYGFDAAGPEFDKNIVEYLKNGDTSAVFSMKRSNVDAAAECGLRSYYILLGTMDGRNFKGNVLSYEGPFGVGYGVLSFQVESFGSRESLLKSLEKSKELETKSVRENESTYVKLARMSLEHYVKYGEHIDMPSFVTSDMLQNKNGVFVSLKKDSELRGCIGTVFPTTNSRAEEIIRNAVEAGENDPRFYPVEDDELDDLIYSVDVLMPPEPAEKKDLDPKDYGVIVRSGNRSGLLLPDLEGVNTIDEQLDIALNKASIRRDEPYTIERFKVVRYR